MVLPNYCYQHSTIPHRHINWFVCHGCRDGTETEPKRSDLDLLSLIATPLLMIIILLAIGENKDYNPQIRN